MPRIVLAALAIGLSVVAASAETPKGPKTVNSQAEAVQEAKDVDLKLVEKADSVVLVMGGHKGGDKITLKGDEVAAIRKALMTGAARASGGEVAANLTFYHGETPLRSVWVYKGGEWGFTRPGTSWTTGLSPDLWKVLSKHDK